MSDEHFTPREVVRVPKPWGHELIWGKTDRYVGKVLHVNRGESLSRQYHNVKDETLYLISGKIRLTLKWEEEERTVTMEVGDSYHIPPRLIHQIEAIEDSDIVEVSTPELDDVVRLADRYGRTGT
ncbi:MAG TPA: cupin domain-containing protein [Thermoanaerobaculia bacterium]|nr:cupin domain-containing protein [Thermoanaerobaculia bacterium]